ncbi:MAG TPA: hypothetical protein PK989_14315 [Anaerolineales bacterium]|nr:hypothetical protein [Anaerolineales bacterium]
MNIYRKLLRWWIALTSVVGFVGGWVYIARATEVGTVTYIGNTAVTMPDLEPIPAVEGLAGNQLSVNTVQTFTFSQSASQQSFSPPMRTGGS